MSRVKQDEKWLTPQQNRTFMAERFKKEHGINIDGEPVESLEEEKPNETVIEQNIEEAPKVEESTDGSETPAIPEPKEEIPKEAPKKRGRPPKK